MKKFIVLFTAALIALSCTEKQRPDPVGPDGGGEEAVLVKAPAITLDVESVVLYPPEAKLTEKIGFSVESEEEVQVAAASNSAIVEVEYDKETAKGTLYVSAKETVILKGSVILTAKNKWGLNTATLRVESASLTIQEEPVLLGSEAGTKTIEISTNVPITASTESDWLVVQTEGESAVKLLYLANEDKLNERTASLAIKDKKSGTLTGTLAVKQTTAEDPLLALTDIELLHRIYDKLTIEPQQYSDGTWSKKEDYLYQWFDEDRRLWTGVDFSGDKVVALHLSSAPFNCELPEEIGYLRSLKELWIIGSGTEWKGEIPESFKQLTKLRDFEIHDTNIGGDLPEWLLCLTNIRYFSVCGSCFTGNLPLFLANMPNLENFGYSLNCFDGKIDESLTKTKWWNTPCSGSLNPADIGRPLGELELEMGQKEGHRLWL